MIYAIVGTYDDTHYGSIRGNGKTNTMVYFGYQAHKEGKSVYSNIKTEFSKTFTLNEIIDMFKNQGLSNSVIMLDEAQVYLSNTGEKASVIRELINLFIAQTRKRGVDIYLTTQRYSNLHKQLRVQVDEILIPLKFHADGSICYLDNCKKPHYIHVFRPGKEDPVIVLDATAVGQLYDSNEIVLDFYTPPQKPKSESSTKRAMRLVTE